MSDLLAEIIFPMAILAIVLGAVCYWLASSSCAAKAAEMGFPGQFGVMTDCMVKVRGKWVPLDSYRVL